MSEKAITNVVYALQPQYLCEKIVEVGKIHWNEERLHRFYGHNNNGFIFGIEWQDSEDNYECQWFKTNKERDKEYKKIKGEK